MNPLYTIKLLLVIALITWALFPSTITNKSYTKVFQAISPDTEFKVVVYRTKILSPLSLYKYLKDEDYFFIIYDNNNNEIFKPSPYYGTSEISAYDSIKFVYGEQRALFYPSDEGYDSFELPKLAK